MDPPLPSPSTPVLLARWERPTSLAKLSSPSERVLSTCRGACPQTLIFGRPKATPPAQGNARVSACTCSPTPFQRLRFQEVRLAQTATKLNRQTSPVKGEVVARSENRVRGDYRSCPGSHTVGLGRAVSSLTKLSFVNRWRDARAGPRVTAHRPSGGILC